MNRLTARINWLWRLVMTGFCFVLFGAGGLLLSLVWFNLLLIAQRDRAKRRRLARRSIAARQRSKFSGLLRSPYRLYTWVHM